MEEEFWKQIDNQHEEFVNDFSTRLMHSFINFPRYDQCQRILETGCGSGNAVPLILKRAPSTAQIVCTDTSPSRIEKAIAKQFERTTFLVQNAESLELVTMNSTCTSQTWF